MQACTLSTLLVTSNVDIDNRLLNLNEKHTAGVKRRPASTEPNGLQFTLDTLFTNAEVSPIACQTIYLLIAVLSISEPIYALRLAAILEFVAFEALSTRGRSDGQNGNQSV